MIQQGVIEPELVGCAVGFWACLLEGGSSVGLVWLILGVCLLGGFVTVGVLWHREVRRDAARLKPRGAARLRVVAGPELRDGTWVRLVAVAPACYRTEIFQNRQWIPAHRDPSAFFVAAPRRVTTPRPD